MDTGGAGGLAEPERVARDDAGDLQPVEPGLGGGAGDAEPFCQRRHGKAGVLGQLCQHLPVEIIQIDL